MTKFDTKYNSKVIQTGSYTNWFSSQFGVICDGILELGECSFKIDENSLEHIYFIHDEIIKILQETYVYPNKELYDKIFSSDIYK